MTYLFIWFWSTVSYQDYPHPPHGNVSAAQVVNRVLSDETTIEEAPKFPENFSSAGMCKYWLHYKTTKKCRIVLSLHQKCYLFSSNSSYIYLQSLPLLRSLKHSPSAGEAGAPRCLARPRTEELCEGRFFFTKVWKQRSILYTRIGDFLGPSVLHS